MDQGEDPADTAANEAARRQRLIGIALMCTAPVCFASLDVSGKVLARAGVDPLLTTFMRSRSTSRSSPPS